MMLGKHMTRFYLKENVFLLTHLAVASTCACAPGVRLDRGENRCPGSACYGWSAGRQMAAKRLYRPSRQGLTLAGSLAKKGLSMPIEKEKTDARQANSERENARVLASSFLIGGIALAGIGIVWFS